MSNLIAFHNDKKIKAKYIKRVKAHRLADELVKGASGQNGKGCAVWCTLDNYEHKAYETVLGIPEWLARVEDTLFEGLPNKRAQTWPEEFLKAIKPGADLNKIKNLFLICILESNLKSMKDCKYDEVAWPQVKEALKLSKEATKQMIAALKNNDKSTAESAESAARSAWSVARSARSAAWLAESAESTAQSAARSAAWSARSAWSVARSARPAESAAWLAESAESAAQSAAQSAESAATYEKFSNELLKLIRACK